MKSLVIFKKIPKTKVALVAALCLAVVVFVCFANLPKTKPVVVQAPQTQSDKATRLLAEQLSNIQSQMAALQQEIKKPKQQVNLNPVIKKMNRLDETIQTVKTNTDGSLREVMGEIKPISKKMDDTAKAIDALKQTQHPVQYLDKSALPFRLIAIDSIQSQAVMAVQYNFHSVALEKGDELAGWKVVALDYGRQVVEFVNKNKAHVVAMMREVG